MLILSSTRAKPTELWPPVLRGPVLFDIADPNTPVFAGLLRAAEHCLVSHAEALKHHF
jgi:hypothetical protein